MEVTTAIVSALVGGGAGVASAALFLWRAGAAWATFKTQTEADIKEMKDDIKDNKEDTDHHIEETRTFAKEQAQAWSSLNRTLGQIEGNLNNRSRRP